MLTNPETIETIPFKATAGLSIAAIRAAAHRLEGVAERTPLLNVPMLDKILGGRLFIKAECLQKTGSFKFRGAYNSIAQLSPADRPRGVIAYSSGNHAQGMAAAANMLNTEATIIMPVDVPQLKLRNTVAWGAEVLTYDRPNGEQREEVAQRIIDKTNPVLIRPYDDWHVMAGQGTMGLEITDQLNQQGLEADAVIAPMGGGGMLAGIATAMAATSPDTEIYGAEPHEFNDLQRSLGSGERLTNDKLIGSICDSIMTAAPGELTWTVLRRLAKGSLTVSDAEVLHAMATAFHFFRIVVEPGGAAALAAVLSGRIDIKDKVVVAVCSGGNVDPGIFGQALDMMKPGTDFGGCPAAGILAR
ncbi:MAG: threonine/serine dehydratase [Alphaproteobacteria bacterium]|nr:threonine/serine dehydratase [Alphaproteobacteria bacterium SS10]